jgi:ubiquinone/menaquinone biosynthesis C-methylase UbiE
MPRTRMGFVSLALLLALFGRSVAQEATAPAKEKSEAREKSGTKKKAPRRARREAPGTYMGRRIADVMSYQGAEWLIRASREEEEQPEAMLDALKIAPGSTVADVGAGVGYTSLRMARRVGPEGLVLATDIQPQMLQMLASNARTAGVENIRPIRSTATDPKLPEGKVDLILMVDVYHECTHPEATLQGLRKALKPGGRLVLVEFRGEDPDVPIKPEHKMTFAQVRREIEPQGFTFKEKFDFLPWQHIIVFEKPADSPAGETEEDAARPKEEG